MASNKLYLLAYHIIGSGELYSFFPSDIEHQCIYDWLMCHNVFFIEATATLKRIASRFATNSRQP